MDHFPKYVENPKNMNHASSQQNTDDVKVTENTYEH